MIKREMESKIRKFVDSFDPKYGFSLPRETSFHMVDLMLSHFGYKSGLKKSEFMY